MITAIPRSYKEWFISTKKALEDEGRPSSNEYVEKMWLDHMTKNDKSGLMKYIHHPDRGARTAIQFGKKDSKETLVLGVKDNEDGTVTVATLDGVYTFNENSSRSLPTKNDRSVVMPIMEDIQKQSRAMEISGFNLPFTPLSASANAWASKYMLIGLSEVSGKIIGPKIEELHRKAKEKSDLYNDTVALIVDGYRDSLLVKKIKVMLDMSGDFKMRDINEVLNIATENGRRTKAVLEDQMPELEKWIDRAIRNKEDRKKLDAIIGRSGFMHLLDNKEVMGELHKGEKEIDEIQKMIPYTQMQLKEATELMRYMMYGEVKSDRVNAKGSKTVEQLAAILALKEDGNWDTFKKLRAADGGKLYVEILKVAGMVKGLHEVVHLGRSNSVGTGSGKVYEGYDGNGILDVYEGTHEYAYATKEELNGYLKDPRWKQVHKAEGDKQDGDLYILARESTGSFQDGIGLNKDVIKNGIQIDTKYAQGMAARYGQEWLIRNNIVKDTDNGYMTYRIVLNQKAKEAVGLKSNIAHTLYRTWVHNAQLVEMATIQKLAAQNMVAKGDAAVETIEKRIGYNRENKDKKELKPFISTKLTYDELKEKYPNVYKEYTPVKNISMYGGFRKNVDYVRKDMEDILIGYPQGSILKGDDTLGITLQRMETIYKQLIVMLKLKLVAANPAKIAMDAVSNVTLLMSMDVDAMEIGRGFSEGMKFANEMSKLEGELVSARLKRTQAESLGEDTKKFDARVKDIETRIEDHPFNRAIKNGFVQSEGTSLLMKEFDTISGLQKSIDDVIKKVVQDKNGNPNKAHDVIVWLMNAGFSVDDILNSVSNMSKIKGTGFGEELAGIADRLAKKKKKDVIKEEEARLGRKLDEDELRDIQNDADTVRYVSEFIAAPSSELVRQGSRAMQMADIMAKWTLYTREVRKALKAKGVDIKDMDTKRLLTEIDKVEDGKELEEAAAQLARTTFIDYRMNLPKELKVLSDYGILMFPAFWIRAQGVIWNLAKYHPINAGVVLLATHLLGSQGASIVDAAIPVKAMNGTLIHGGQNVLTPGTIIPGL